MVIKSPFHSILLSQNKGYGIISNEALSRCIRDAVRTELQEHFKAGGSTDSGSRERLLSKQELAAELGVSLMTLTE